MPSYISIHGVAVDVRVGACGRGTSPSAADSEPPSWAKRSCPNSITSATAVVAVARRLTRIQQFLDVKRAAEAAHATVFLARLKPRTTPRTTTGRRAHAAAAACH